MTMMFEGDIDCTRLSIEQQKDLIRYYVRSMNALDYKLGKLRDGTHTIMSEHGIELLDQIRQAYWRRIQQLYAALSRGIEERH